MNVLATLPVEQRNNMESFPMSVMLIFVFFKHLSVPCTHTRMKDNLIINHFPSQLQASQIPNLSHLLIDSNHLDFSSNYLIHVLICIIVM